MRKKYRLGKTITIGRQEVTLAEPFSLSQKQFSIIKNIVPNYRDYETGKGAFCEDLLKNYFSASCVRLSQTKAKPKPNSSQTQAKLKPNSSQTQAACMPLMRK